MLGVALAMRPQRWLPHSRDRCSLCVCVSVRARARALRMCELDALGSERREDVVDGAHAAQKFHNSRVVIVCLVLSGASPLVVTSQQRPAAARTSQLPPPRQLCGRLVLCSVDRACDEAVLSPLVRFTEPFLRRVLARAWQLVVWHCQSHRTPSRDLSAPTGAHRHNVGRSGPRVVSACKR